MDTEQLIAGIRQKALENDYYSGCAQAVLGALQDNLGLGDTASFKAATILSGGVARRGETCGAMLGALMGLGLACGRERMEDTPAYGAAMNEAQKVVEDFKARLQAEFGFSEGLTSTLCRDIQSRVFGRPFNLEDDEERALFLKSGGHDSNGCPLVCAVAAETAARHILALSGSTEGAGSSRT